MVFIVVRYQGENRTDVYHIPADSNIPYFLEKINDETLSHLFDCGGLATFDVYAVKGEDLAKRITAGYNG